MRHVQDTHVRAPARAALLHHVRGRVKGVDEAHRPGRYAACGANYVALRAQPRKREPGAAAALVNQRGLLDFREYGVQGVLNGQDEAGR